MSRRPDCVEFLCNAINGLTAESGGQHGHQMRVTVQMSGHQVRELIGDLLGGMPEQAAFEFLQGEFPAWFAEVPQ